MKPAVWSLTSVKVFGRENLADLKSPYLVLANHSSHLDAPLVMGALPRRNARYLATNAAADYFFDVRWRRGLTQLFFNAFPVDRTGLRGRNGILHELLDIGVPLLLFPEGTRDSAAFKPGAAALSISRGVPCVPLGIAGASDAMPKGAGFVQGRRPPVTVSIGRPMWPQADEDAVLFSGRLAKEVSALVDEGVERRARQPH
jgi:1-acyl-sn-glycerol-3-phosphate acyltransferase